MFTREGKLRFDQMAMPEELLFRAARILFLQGVIIGYPDREDWFGPFRVGNSILAFNTESIEQPIRLIIDSQGGRVDDGLLLIDQMRMSKAPVYTIGKWTASLATVILAAGEPGHRYVFPHARVMLHLPAGQMRGDVKDVAIQQKELEKARDQMISVLQECGVKHNKKKILKDMDRDYWMGAEEAIDYGIADLIVEDVEAMGLPGRNLKKTKE